MKRRRIRILPLLGVLACAGLVAVVANAYNAPPPTEPRDTDIEHAQRELTPSLGADDRMDVRKGNFVGGNGVVEPADREISVAGDVAARIVKIDVAEGDFVEAGAPLVHLQSADQEAAWAAARADVDAAKAELLRTVNGSRREDVAAAMAESESARARAELSAGVLQRFEAVVSAGGATLDEVERARQQAKVDEGTAIQSEARRDAVVHGSRTEDVSGARARLAAAQARARQAQVALTQRTVLAPASGEILQSKYRVGEYYAPGGADPLIIMGDTRTLRVRMDVDERDIAKVVLGAKAMIRVPAHPGRDFTGQVVEIGRRMGRKNIRTDDPIERNDTKILEVVVKLDETDDLVVGQRGMVYVVSSTAGEHVAGG